MKILAINASHRADRGLTHFLIEKLFSGARENGADCEEVLLAALKIERCLACDRCQESSHYLKCVHAGRDDVGAVFRKMAAADLIVYATPVYIFGMTGLMKTFLDRLKSTSDSNILRVTGSGLLFHHIDPAVCSKPFVCLVCCDNLEAATPATVISYFRTFARFMDAPMKGTLVRSGGKLFGYGKDPSRENHLPIIGQVFAAYQQAGRDLALYGRIRPATQRCANREILPVPFFGWIKRLRIRALKQKFIEHARLWL